MECGVFYADEVNQVGEAHIDLDNPHEQQKLVMHICDFLV